MIPDSPIFGPEFETMTLERIRVMATQAMSGHSLANLKFETYKQPHELAMNDLVYMLSTEILSEKVQEVSETIKTPASWWDAFKEAKFPLWLRKKYPVKYRTRTVIMKRYAGYPKFKQVMPDAGPVAINFTVDKDEHTETESPIVQDSQFFVIRLDASHYMSERGMLGALMHNLDRVGSYVNDISVKKVRTLVGMKVADTLE